ncbi:putative membrane protein [Undibacterium sp. GrIS 1.8]|uniref:DUF2339 domain-containing protein n=1 Tax=Undibacterium sp. GrIS 1.8 TaxID=3143934 RepID=UPI003395BBE6
MWILGAIIGLILGIATSSTNAAVLYVIVGGFAAHVLKQVLSQNSRNKKSDDGKSQNAELVELRGQVAALERRLQTVERQLAASSAVSKQSHISEVETDQVPALDVIAEPVIGPVAAVPMVPSAPISKTIQTSSLAEAINEMAAILKPESVAAPADPAVTELAAKPTQAAVIKANTNNAQISVTASTSATTPAATARPTIAPRRPPVPQIPFRDRLPEPVRNLIYGGNALVKTGVLILFLGLAFLLRYTAERVTVPIELRYAGVALVGMFLLGLGWFLRHKRRDYGLILQGMGVGVFYLTTLAAIKFHGLIPAEAGFGFMLAVSLLGAALAILQKAPALAIIAALEGFATPVLTSTGGNHMVGLFTYLTILDVGIVLIAWFNAWRVLNVIGFVGTFTLASGWANQYYSDAQYPTVQAFLIVFFLLFTAVGLLFARRTLIDAKLGSKLAEADSLAKQAGAALVQVGRVDSALVFGTPLTAFSLQYLLMKPWEFGAAFSALALSGFYLLLARIVFSKEKTGLALLAEAYAIVGVIFGTLAIPLGLEGVWTGAAWAVEGAGMHWLGVRQRRPYARGFSYLVLLGASYKLLNTITIDATAVGHFLHGSSIGPILLAASAFAMWLQHRRAALNTTDHWEAIPGSLLPWLGMAALTVLPWQWFVPSVAAAATAVLSVVTFGVANRWRLKPLLPIVGTLQVVAVVSFIAGLHRSASSLVPANGALESGTQGLLTALVIAACILFTAGWRMAAILREAKQNNQAPNWSLANSVAVVAGVGLLHLAMLFAINFQQAALIWPITACLALWVALRMSHSALAAFSLLLQVFSVPLFLLYQTDAPALAQLDALADSGSLMNNSFNFWTPLVFGLAAWFSGDRLQMAAKQSIDNDASMSAKSWLSLDVLLWAPVVWGLLWLLRALFDEAAYRLLNPDLFSFIPTSRIAIVLMLSIVMSVLARWRNWSQMGQATFFTLPALMLIGLIELFRAAYGTGVFIPSQALGWLLWPIALAWHLRLLFVQARWSEHFFRKLFHVCGFWFFVLLGAREVQWQMSSISQPWSAWPMLGWILVPAISLWLVRSQFVLLRWPLTEFRQAYVEIAGTPVAAYLFLWCCISNVLSAGSAAPLPYIPLINPLELGQWLVLAALVTWWRALPVKAYDEQLKSTISKLVAALALALITGLVLRTVHHWASVEWQFDSLFASWLAQAAVSITWAIAGVAAMLFGNRRGSRSVWMAGAGLLVVVVLKLFIVELADRGGLYRIVSFIGVGVLLLVVGYFAPVPVKKESSHAEKSDLKPDAEPVSKPESGATV